MLLPCGHAGLCARDAASVQLCPFCRTPIEDRVPMAKDGAERELPAASLAPKAIWAANKRFEISKFKFKFPRARTYEIIGLVLGCIEAKFCK